MPHHADSPVWSGWAFGHGVWMYVLLFHDGSSLYFGHDPIGGTAQP